MYLKTHIVLDDFSSRSIIMQIHEGAGVVLAFFFRVDETANEAGREADVVAAAAPGEDGTVRSDRSTSSVGPSALAVAQHASRTRASDRMRHSRR